MRARRRVENRLSLIRQLGGSWRRRGASGRRRLMLLVFLVGLLVMVGAGAFLSTRAESSAAAGWSVPAAPLRLPAECAIASVLRIERLLEHPTLGQSLRAVGGNFADRISRDQQVRDALNKSGLDSTSGLTLVSVCLRPHKKHLLVVAEGRFNAPALFGALSERLGTPELRSGFPTLRTVPGEMMVALAGKDRLVIANHESMIDDAALRGSSSTPDELAGDADVAVRFAQVGGPLLSKFPASTHMAWLGQTRDGWFKANVRTGTLELHIRSASVQTATEGVRQAETLLRSVANTEAASQGHGHGSGAESLPAAVRELLGSATVRREQDAIVMRAPLSESVLRFLGQLFQARLSPNTTE